MNDEILDELELEPARLNYASFYLRFLAYLTDIIPIMIVAGFVLYYIFGISPFETIVALEYQDGILTENKQKSIVRLRNISFVIWMLYSIYADASIQQGTFGKANAQMKVVDGKGNRISQRQSVIRNLSKIISYFPLGLGFIWAAFDKKNRTWHDMIAKTFVIETN